MSFRYRWRLMATVALHKVTAAIVTPEVIPSPVRYTATSAPVLTGAA
jgi:hypothetical protein